jgi:putative oxidoreductase
LICNAVEAMRVGSTSEEIASQVLAASGGILLIAGLWTPVAGILMAVVETWIMFAHPGDGWVPLLLAVMGAVLAMVGPGAHSVDARLFGRKRIEPPSI